jgi:hypothetical protein
MGESGTGDSRLQRQLSAKRPGTHPGRFVFSPLSLQAKIFRNPKAGRTFCLYPPRGDRHPSPLPADTAEPRPARAGAFSLGSWRPGGRFADPTRIRHPGLDPGSMNAAVAAFQQCRIHGIRLRRMTIERRKPASKPTGVRICSICLTIEHTGNIKDFQCRIVFIRIKVPYRALGGCG